MSDDQLAPPLLWVRGMSVRITTQPAVPVTVLQIDGRLDVEAVASLIEAWQHVDGPAALDLRHLQWMDEAGTQVIRRFAARGVQLLNLSPLHELQLEGTPITSAIDDE
ncbi:MAG: hypothetical protein GKS06_02195 [Acidobacteria bacterium]|nr:hypothetical protein [Acidobacteriota bacterium]